MFMLLYADVNHGTKRVRKPKAWKHPQPITMAQLRQMREEFWDTAPHYGGQKGILSSHLWFCLLVLGILF
jgi:hypothetical protein